MSVTINGSTGISGVDGTASTPAVQGGDSNTGVFFPAADNIGFTTGGTIRGRWTTDGLCFNADTAAANALDDYEEGTHAVTLTPSVSGSFTLNASYDTLAYCKIGSFVTVQGVVIVSSSSSPVGYVAVSLPFALANLTDGGGVATGSITVDGSTGANANQYIIIGLGGASEARIYLGDSVAFQADSAQGVGSSGQIYMSITYRTT